MLSRAALRALRPARTLPGVRTTSAAAAAYQPPAGVLAWIDELTTRPPQLTTDMIASERATQLLRSLPTREDVAGSSGSDMKGTLPKSYHMIYFQTREWLDELATDGTSAEYNAPAPFARRMWAGGAFEWNPATPLRLDEEATQVVSVRGVSVKSERMMFVHQQREVRPSSAGAGAWAVREERNHVFQPNEVVQDKTRPKGAPSAADMPTPDYTLAYTPSSPLLFRYSALTYNAHKIHYDLAWTRSMEGHPDLVVHGPMTATLLVELADRAAGDTGTHLTRFEYRASSPMYVDREIKLQAAWEKRGERMVVWAEQEGRVGMKATATYTPA